MASALEEIQKFSKNTSIAAKNALEKLASDINSGVDSLKNALAGKTEGLQVKTEFSQNDFGKLPVRLSGRSPEEARLEQKAYSGVLTFPVDLKYQAIFHFSSYKRVSVGVEAIDLPNVTIALPMPANLKETFSAAYDEPALGPLVGSGADYIGSKLRELQGAAPEPAQDAKTLGGTATGNVGAAVLGAVKSGLGKTSEALGSAAMKQTGIAPNPHLAMVFKQVSLRTHSFEYTLAATSEAEMKMVQRIIRTLRERMLPGLAEGQDMLFTFPDVCDISFMPRMNSPYKIKRSVLTDLTVDYAPQGPAFFRSGDPVMVNISMTFKEIDAYTRRDVPAEYTDSDYL